MDPEGTLNRRIESQDSINDYLDRIYGKMEYQKEVHNGSIKVRIQSADLLREVLSNLNSGMEGGGNYIVFYRDRMVLISDADKLGIQQYATFYPGANEYEFLTDVDMETRRVARVILKAKFSSMKTALAKDRGTRTRDRKLDIAKEAIIPDINLQLITAGVVSSPFTLNCTIVSELPLRHADGGNDPIWTGSLTELSKSLSSICSSRADRVRVYVRTDGGGMMFYAHHATSGVATRSSLGSVSSDDFDSIDKGTRLVPRETTAFIEYHLTKKALKCAHKLNNESNNDSVSFYSSPGGILRIESTIGSGSDSHVLYLY